MAEPTVVELMGGLLDGKSMVIPDGSGTPPQRLVFTHPNVPEALTYLFVDQAMTGLETGEPVKLRRYRFEAALT